MDFKRGFFGPKNQQILALLDQLWDVLETFEDTM